MSIGAIFKDIQNLAAKCAHDKSLTSLSDVKDLDYREMVYSAAMELAEEIRADMVASFSDAGLHSESGTMLAALRSMEIQPLKGGIGIKISFKGGITYPDGEGNFYGAAGAFKYGARRGAKKVKNAVTKKREKIGGTAIAAKPGFMDVTDTRRRELELDLAQRLKRKLRERGIRVQ